MKRHLAVLPVVAAALVLAGCDSGNQTTGGPTDGSTGNSGSSPSSSSNSASGTSNVKPCLLLSSSDISQNGLGKGKPGNDGGARSCTWDNSTADQGNGYTLGVDVRDRQGIDSINTEDYTVTSIGTIDGHQAKQGQQTGGIGCFVFLAVGTSSRVDVSVSGDPSTSCQLANQFAKLIAPNLPDGNG